MLKFWRSHVDYQSFVLDTISSFSETELLKLQSYSQSREKLDSLNLDPIGVLLAPYYKENYDSKHMLYCHFQDVHNCYQH